MKELTVWVQADISGSQWVQLNLGFASTLVAETAVTLYKFFCTPFPQE